VAARKPSRAQRELADFDVVFKALAHATRRHILIVIEAGGGRITAGRIADRFAHSWPTVSRHLAVLEQSGLVRSQAVGRERHYEIDKKRLFQVGRRWFDYFDEENR
jgi:DNA-binding transcriptional ArsR family regulator